MLSERVGQTNWLRWLKAGVVELGALDPTTMGTPQGAGITL
jgi:hypothetical protein